MKGFEHPETTKTWDALYYGDPLSIRFYDAAIQRVLDLVNPAPGERLLDAGCGAGVHAIRAARGGYSVDAIDYSSAALEDASERAQAAGFHDRIRFAHGDLTKLDIHDGAYKSVFSWGVLIHIPEIEKALDELVRILADGGRIALYVSNSSALQLKLARIKRVLTRRQSSLERLPLGLGTRAELHGESIWVWFNDTDALVRYLQERGLRLVCRQAGEFTDWHLRFSGAFRRLFLRLNNFWFEHRLPAGMAHMNLLVFEKAERPPGDHSALRPASRR